MERELTGKKVKLQSAPRRRRHRAQQRERELTGKKVKLQSAPRRRRHRAQTAMSSNRHGGWNPNSEPMPLDFQDLLADEHDDFEDADEVEASFVGQEVVFEEVEEGSESEMGDEPDVYSDAEDQPFDIENMPMHFGEEVEVEASLGDLGAGPSWLSMPPPPSPSPPPSSSGLWSTPLAMDVDALTVRAEDEVQPDDGQQGDIGGHSDDSSNGGEVDPGAMNDDEWMPNVRVGDRGHAAVGGRGGIRGRGRGRGRGGRGARVAVRGRGRGRRGAVGDAGWLRGDGLNEVYPTDDDLPPETRERFAQQMPVEDGREEGDGQNDDGVADVNDVMQDYARFCANENACRFNWKPMNSFQGVKEQFQDGDTGPTSIFKTGYEAFRAIWDSATVSFIAEQTNAHAAVLSVTDAEFRKRWYNTNEHEILMLISFWMMLGVVQLPSINSCFSNDPFLHTAIFRRLFSRSRYWDLNRALRFSPDDPTDKDVLRLIRPILRMLNEKFQRLYKLSQSICIDESLTLWKGNVSFRQYIKTKAAKYGIKTFELCESATGYLYSFFVYTGAELGPGTTAVGKTVQTVLHLIQPLLRKGHTLFMDNWFNSPLLARFLKRNQTDCVGTLRRNRKNVPPIVAGLNLRRGSYVARHAEDVSLISFNDRKPLVILSTYHGTETNTTEARRGHPSEHRFLSVKDYNAGMGGVDRKDQMLEPYLIERKQCTFWFKKLFKRLVNVSIINSRILVQQSDPAKTPIKQLNFRLDLAKALIRAHMHLVPFPRVAEPAVLALHHDQDNFPPYRRQPQPFHYPQRTTDQDAAPGARRTVGPTHRSTNRKRCVWCTKRHKKEKRTVWECAVCKVPLCLEDCFPKFHTLP